MSLARRAGLLLILALGARAQRMSAQGRIVGTVYDSLVRSATLKGSTVAVLGTTLMAITDDRGRFRLDSVPAGHRQLAFFHGMLDSLGVAAPVRVVDVPASGELRVTLTTPSRKALRENRCPDLTDRSAGLVMGLVRDAEAEAALAGAEVFTTWMELVSISGHLQSEVRRVSAVTSSDGVYALCGVPVDVPFFVRARKGDQASGGVEVFLENREAAVQHLVVSLADTTARVSVDSMLDATTSDSTRRPPGSARVTGRVRDAAGRPVKGARIAVLGTGETAITDEAGTFFIGRIPAGTQTFEVRAIGFAPSRRGVDLASTHVTDVVLAIDRRVTTLPSVTVIGAANRASRTGFAERERQGLGHFLNSAQIEHMGGINLMDVLWRAPGLHPVFREINGRVVQRVVMRGTPTLSNGGGITCVPNLYVDGALMIDFWDDLQNFFMKNQIVGVEVYVGFGTIPAQFDRYNGCGSVVVWTKW